MSECKVNYKLHGSNLIPVQVCTMCMYVQCVYANPIKERESRAYEFQINFKVDREMLLNISLHGDTRA